MIKKLKEYKIVIYIALAFTLLFGGYFSYFGGGERIAANKIADKIEEYRGDGIKKKFDEVIIEKYSLLTANLSPEEKAKYINQIKQNLKKIEAKLDYTNLTTKTENGVGYAVIKSPTLSINDTANGNKVELKMSELEVGVKGNNPDHLFFNGKGELEIFLENMGAKQKVLGISYENFMGETNSDEINHKLSTKFSANNLAVLEGRSNTAVVKIASVNQEQEIVSGGGLKNSNTAKLEFKNIEAGDFIKMMLGATPPITLRADYRFDGEDLVTAYDHFFSVSANQKNTELEGLLKLNSFELLLAEAGIKAAGIVEFKKENTNNMPIGAGKITIQNYKSLRDLITGFIKTPPDKIQNIDEFFSEIAIAENADYIFNVVFDGSEQVKINGKTTQEIKDISFKYFSANPPQDVGNFKPSADGTISAARQPKLNANH